MSDSTFYSWKIIKYSCSGRYVLANHALRDKKVILFYFAARSAAQDFAPYLREAYEVRLRQEIFQC